MLYRMLPNARSSEVFKCKCKWSIEKVASCCWYPVHLRSFTVRLFFVLTHIQMTCSYMSALNNKYHQGQVSYIMHATFEKYARAYCARYAYLISNRIHLVVIRVLLYMYIARVNERREYFTILLYFTTVDATWLQWPCLISIYVDVNCNNKMHSLKSLINVADVRFYECLQNSLFFFRISKFNRYK